MTYPSAASGRRFAFSTVALTLCLILGLGGTLLTTTRPAPERTTLDYRITDPHPDAADGFGPVATELAANAQKLDLPNAETYPTFATASNIAVLDDILLADNYDRAGLQAYHLPDGAIAWKAPLAMVSPPVQVGANGIMVVSKDGVGGLLSLDIATGAERWFSPMPIRGNTSFAARQPVVIGDTVYVSDGSTNLYAIAAATGTTRWLTTIRDDDGSDATGYLGAQLVVSGDAIMQATSDGWLYALGAADGQIKWGNQFHELVNEESFGNLNLAADSNRVYLSSWNVVTPYAGATPVFETSQNIAPATVFATSSAKIQAYETATGNPVWENTTVSAFGDGLAIIGSSLLVPNYDAIPVLDATTGIAKPDMLAEPEEVGYRGTLRTSDGRGYFAATLGTTTRVVAVDANGLLQTWRIAVTGADDTGIALDLFSWREGLLIRDFEGGLHWIPPANPATPAATPLASPVAATTPQTINGVAPVADDLAEEALPLDLPAGADLPAQLTDSIVALFGDVLIAGEPGRAGTRAFHLPDGASLWERPDRLLSQPVPDGDSAYAFVMKADGSAGLVKFAIATGEEQWVATLPYLGSSAPPPIVANGMVYVSDNAQTVFAFNAATGALDWQFAMPDESVPANPWESSRLTAAGDTLALVTPGGTLYAISATSHEIMWQFTMPAVAPGDQRVPGLAADTNRIYLTWSMLSPSSTDPQAFAVLPGMVMAFDAATGEQVWQTRMEAGMGGGKPILADGLLLLPSMLDVQVVNAVDGKPARQKIVYSTPETLFSYDILVSGESAFTTAMRGEHLWIFRIEIGAIEQTWHLTMPAAEMEPSETDQTTYTPNLIFIWQEGLLIRASDGQFYVIPPAGEATPAA